MRRKTDEKDDAKGEGILVGDAMDEAPAGCEDDETTCAVPDWSERDENGVLEDEDLEEEPIPQIQEMTRRLKRIVKVIDILEFVDSCLIVGERFLRDDEEARGLIEEIRDKILNVETIFSDYLITGKISKVV